MTLRVHLHMCGFVRIDCVRGKRTDENCVGVNEMREFMSVRQDLKHLFSPAFFSIR